ncbi:hypothetical protein HEB94_001438 [Actinopolymorpha pittospori]|uniref:Glucose-methanol-choline oxidoreductase N-terminal domain-containing protein n=1 Tax=Actinopolymorpha pittospori TaxID=648752 RepID=A0A927RA30_9ACTN|nr:GMC family oxidoreductase N-terminal domain-containing protein [Actinopolymorpha pittospori]MBE1604590.1 hypothetical protein [Actinopolymorpha pittospori]
MSANITPEQDIDGRYFDHIVVGGGAAGCVVAARLSERGDRDVLLLEAGAPDTDPAIFAPRGVSQLQRGEHDWCDVTVPQPALGGREVPVSAGRVLGGGGSINFLAWYRGHRLDYDGWAANGMPGWSWSEVLPRFRRSEDHELGTSPLHGSGGPIPVTTAKSIHPMSLAFIAAGVEAGLPFNRDFNGAELEGVGLLSSNVGAGERVSTAHGYLRPVRNRPHLSVHTHALVQRVVLHHGAARGVVFTTADGREVSVRGPRWCCARDHCVPRNSSCSPASARPGTCGTWESRWSGTCPASARTCTTTPRRPLPGRSSTGPPGRTTTPRTTGSATPTNGAVRWRRSVRRAGSCAAAGTRPLPTSS